MVHIDIHALQSVPYNNLNRDALGSPKSTIYGGKTRTRVSSQSWKRAVRFEVERQLGEPTMRTRGIASAVSHALTQHRQWDAETARKAGRAVMVAADTAAKRSGSKEGGILPAVENDQSKVLFWIPTSVVTELADLCEQHRDAIAATVLPTDEEVTKGKLKAKAELVLPAAEIDETLRRRSPSINLLGRMLAEMPGHGVDGATLFAHAFTTHESSMDFDFFTAVDDWTNQGEDTGSGHLATAEFTSGVFYRYSSINITDLAHNLGTTDEALRTVDTYLRAFTTAVPSGKQRTTGAVTRPELVHLALRHQPLSLAGAFEKPVTFDRHGEGGFAAPSRQRLADYAGRLHRFLGADDMLWHGHASIDDIPYPALGDHNDTLHNLIVEAMNQAGDAA